MSFNKEKTGKAKFGKEKSGKSNVKNTIKNNVKKTRSPRVGRGQSAAKAGALVGTAALAENELPENALTESVVGAPGKSEGDKLQKILAAEGVGSRREMERVIQEGGVSVNGKVAELGARVHPGDKVVVGGKRFTVPENTSQSTRVILYNKPEGEITSRKDPEGRPTVFDRLPALQSGRWISVGRLDINTSGLLLFTNNGELANKLMHPSTGIDREYLVRIHGNVDEDMIERLKEGIVLEEGHARFTDIRPSNKTGSNNTNKWFYCALMEGRNREVRRLWESQDVQVSRLKRVRYGNIFIPSYVKVGQWIEFEHKDLVDLCKTAGIEPPRKPKFKASAHEAKMRRLNKLKHSGPKGRKGRGR